ncbi:MAG: protein kinase [Anaerolineae bacterium]
MQDLSGQTVRGYELRERIGAGGFGAVYRAYQAGLNREVAVKIILPERANKPEFIKRFEAEARVVAQLDHLHIVPLFDYWREDDGTAYLVMRWLRGGSLRSLVHTTPLSLDSAVRIIDQICGALSFAHQHGIIHRDIKPDNILLDEDRNAYLSDFGIAKSTFSTTPITSTDSAPGTPAYSAPEQVGGGKVTPQTDLYALGITLYECLIGSHPFPESPLQHLYENLPSVAHQRRDLPIAIDEVIQRATMKRASMRFPDALSFSTALRAVVRSTPSQGSGASIASSHADVPDGEKTLTDARHIGSRVNPRSTFEISSSRRDLPVQQSAVLIHDAMDIPSRPETLIGRDSLLNEINALLDKGGRVLLQGLGGMGKTSLAAETVARRVESSGGPILWLRAAGDDASQWLIALARPFDGHQAIALGKSETQAQSIRSLLKDQGVKLVVLDDAWDGQALKIIIDAMPPGLPVLVTSRQRFPVGKILDVGELDTVQALELLNFHASEVFTPDDADAVDLCDRLGNHPFTLEIAGKTLQVDGLTPAELIARIADAPHLMEMPEGYADAGRTSAKELINDSVMVLDEPTRAVFLAYGAFFVPEVTSELLAAAMSQSVKTIEELLTVLGRRGLVRRKRAGSLTTYAVHDLVFSFARTAPSLAKLDVINACRAYSALHKHEFDALDAERSNILKAAEAAYGMGESGATIAIMRALCVDGSYFNARGHDALLLSVLDKAIQSARLATDMQGETLHFLLSRRGNAYYNSNDLKRALADYQEALDLAKLLKMPHREVILRCVISKIFSDQQAFQDAELELGQAGELAQASGDDSLIARVLEQRGYHFAQAKHDFESAREIYMQQVALAQKLNDPERLFFALQNLSAAENELTDFRSSAAHADQALDIARRQDNHLWIAYALFPLAQAYHGLGEENAASDALASSLHLHKQIGNQRMVEEVQTYMQQHGYAIPHDHP